MRIFSILFKSLVALLIIIAIVFFISREVLLVVATSTVKNSLLQLKQAYTQNKYTDDCLARGSQSLDGEELVILQLRFVSASEYVTEAICGQFSLSPIEIAQVSLPPMVQKEKGESGIFWRDLTRTGITLVVFQDQANMLEEWLQRDMQWIARRAHIAVDDRQVVSTNGDTELQPGPITTCSGYSFGCCEEITEVGVGDQIVGAKECQTSCFSSCQARPVILSFTSNPFFEPQTRTVAVTSNQLVEFRYVATQESGENVTAVIDFGDGETARLSGIQGSTSHIYNCTTSQCQYTVSLILSNAQGVESATTTLSNLLVVVKQ